MSDTRPAFDNVSDAARLALARGDRDGARASLISVLQTARSDAVNGTESVESMLRLGALYQDAGLDAEAERLFSDAVAIAETTVGGEDLGLAAALSCLGTRLLARGANDEAEPLLRRSLDISQGQLGIDHPDLNGLLTILSRLYLKQGAFARAEPLLERLLALKRAKGEEHPEVATVLASLALVRQGLGDHEGAEQLSRRVLQIREKTLAPNHYAIASALELLADECAARGKVEEAGRMYRRALSIREQTLGVSHASLRVLRERIVDLQLQADDLDGDAGVLSIPDAAPPAFVVSRVPLETPRASVAVSPPIAPAPSPPAPPAVVPRAGIAFAAPHASPGAVANLDERDDQLQRALVLPAATGLLSLHEELQNLENEMNAESSIRSPLERFRYGASRLSAALSTRGAQVTVAATTGVIVLLAALSALPRTAESRADGTSAGTHPARPVEHQGRATSTPATDSADSSSPLIRTSAGSVALRTASNTPAPAPSREQGPRADREVPHRAAEPAPPLELSRNVRLPVPTVSVGRADSIARASEEAPKPGEGFSKQFWTNGIDKRPAETSGPTSARLIGQMPQPVYPVFLRRNNVEGEVVVQFVVDENGKPDMATFEVVHSPHDAMTASVRKVIEGVRFEPARSGGATPTPRSEVVRSSFLFKAGVK